MTTNPSEKFNDPYHLPKRGIGTLRDKESESSVPILVFQGVINGLMILALPAFVFAGFMSVAAIHVSKNKFMLVLWLVLCFAFVVTAATSSIVSYVYLFLGQNQKAQKVGWLPLTSLVALFAVGAILSFLERILGIRF